MDKLDCRGLACPEPVLKVKSLLEAMEEGSAAVVVDNLAARENVARFAKNAGCGVEVSQTGPSEWELSLVKGYSCEAAAAKPGQGADGAPTALLMLSNQMGKHPELGGVLLRALVATLSKATVPPRRIIFMNEGVRLTSEGSEVLEELSTLAGKGVELLSCGTCLDFFGLKEKLKVGVVTNMFDTVETLTTGFRVVTIA